MPGRDESYLLAITLLLKVLNRDNISKVVVITTSNLLPFCDFQSHPQLKMPHWCTLPYKEDFENSAPAEDKLGFCSNLAGETLPFINLPIWERTFGNSKGGSKDLIGSTIIIPCVNNKATSN